MPCQEYKVSVYYSRMPFPLTLWVHCYIVKEFQDAIDRFDIFHPLTMGKHPTQYYGRIYKNSFPAHSGLKFYITNKMDSLLRFVGQEYSTVCGAINSPAHKLYEFIANDGLKKYPNACKYDMILGPNSNSFIQWIIDQVPDNGLHLPLTAWGKNYRHEK